MDCHLSDFTKDLTQRVESPFPSGHHMIGISFFFSMFPTHREESKLVNRFFKAGK